MLEAKTPKAIPQRRRPGLWQTYSYNFRRPYRPKFKPGASQSVLNLRRDHAPLFVFPFSTAK